MQQHSPDVSKAVQCGDKLAQVCTPPEQEPVKFRQDDIKRRYKNICDKVVLRKVQLDKALATSQVFGESEESLMRWMTETERTLSRLEPISVDPVRVEKQHQDHMVYSWHEINTTPSVSGGGLTTYQSLLLQQFALQL